jgi:hypothetical protein
MITETTSHAAVGVAPRISTINQAAARVAFATGAACIASLAALHFLDGAVDPSWAPISQYALGRHGWVMTCAFLAWGISAVSVFVALRTSVVTRAGRVGLGFLLVGAAGPIVAALFPMDPITTPPEAMTTSGSLHGLGAVLGDAFPIAATLLSWSLVKNDARWRQARRALIATTALAWAGVVGLTLSMIYWLPQHGGQLGPDVPVGWQGRFMVVALVAWLMTAARSAVHAARGDRS